MLLALGYSWILVAVSKGARGDEGSDKTVNKAI